VIFVPLICIPLFNYDIPPAHWRLGIWTGRIGHPEPEVLACHLVFPAHLQHERPIHLYRPLFAKGALLYTTTAIPAFVRVHNNGWSPFGRIWQEHIHLARFYATVARYANIFINFDWFARCDQVRDSLCLSSSHLSRFHSQATVGLVVLLERFVVIDRQFPNLDLTAIQFRRNPLMPLRRVYLRIVGSLKTKPCTARFPC
jgi:hypothetical protein